LNIREFEPGEAFEVNDLHFEPFSTSHDAVDSVGFAFHCGRHKAGLATDLGYASHLVIERLRGVNLLVLESNHDPKMLKDGPYPWHLKQRVSGRIPLERGLAG
jgi:phosphoribosyl 1,2-cyclic phosphodiesterase